MSINKVPSIKQTPKSFQKFLSHFDVRSLPEIRWLHRVNKPSRVQRFLNSDAHMAEGDIMMGKTNTPVMRHPHSVAKDHALPFTEWIDVIMADETKGAKLDFKEVAAAEKSLEYLKKIATIENSHRIFISLDILEGPCGNKPYFSKNFLYDIRKEFPQIILSPGHTTKYPRDNNDGYTPAMIEDMCEVINNLAPPITVAVRAELLLKSDRKIIQNLLKNPETSLTIWSGRDTYVGKENWPQIFLEQYGKRAILDLVNQKLEPLRIPSEIL